jgi:MFS transporter, YNFM family, putative membrane transport protein
MPARPDRRWLRRGMPALTCPGEGCCAGRGREGGARVADRPVASDVRLARPVSHRAVLLPYLPRHARMRQMLTVTLLGICGLFVVGLLSVWIPLGPGLERTYGVSTTATAVAGSLFAAAFAFGGLASGPLADRYGRRPVLLGGLLALWLTSLAVAASPTWPTHLAARIGQGLAAGSSPAVALTWTAEILPASRRRIGVALLMTAYQAAAVTGQLYGQVVEQVAGWRAVYTSLAVIYGIVLLFLAARLREPEVATAAAAARGSLLRELRRLLGVGPLLAAWLLGALLWGGMLAMYAAAQIQVQFTAAPDHEATLLRIRIAGLGGMLLVLPLLRMLQRRSGIELIAFGVTAAVVGLLVQFSGGLASLAAGSVLVAFGTTFAMAPLTEFISQLAPMARASALAGQGFTLDMGAAAGAIVSARIGYVELCGFLAVGMAAGAFVLAVSAEAASQRSAAPRPAAESDRSTPTGPLPTPPSDAAPAGERRNAAKG